MKILIKAIDDNALIQIINSGIKPTDYYFNEHSQLYDAMFDNVLSIQESPEKQIRVEFSNNLEQFIIGGSDYLEIHILNY